MDQTHSVFMPGLTRRGPVYNSAGENAFGALTMPTLSPMIKYAIMAGLVYLGAKKKIPFGLYGGIGAAFAVWQLFPDASSLVPASGVPMPNVQFPAGSISGMYNPTNYSATDGFYRE
jgi:hypothetical protein